MKLFDISTDMIPKPDLLIYLKASVPTLVKQIRKRGREYEQNIDVGYLERLNERYNNWIDNDYKGEVYVINKDEYDFVANPEILEPLYEKLDAIYGKTLF
jgi:deoxyadenosine/deoxycytidine kinase